MLSRNIFVTGCRLDIGAPYRWGAKGPDAFDCSGFVTYHLKQTPLYEKIPDQNTDVLCHTIFHEFKVQRDSEMKNILPGMLFFYGKDDVDMDHVMVVNQVWGPGMFTLMGARGGTAATTSIEVAYRGAAFVDVVIGTYWFDRLRHIVDPFIREKP